MNLEARILQELREMRQHAENNHYFDAAGMHQSAESLLLKAVDPLIAEEFKALKRIAGFEYD